jgi:PhnB protein
MSITLTPYLSFNGNTREVFRFYEQALGAKIEAMMSFADMPKMPEPAEGCEGGMPAGDGIMHACLQLPGGAMLMAGDVPAGMPYQGIKRRDARAAIRHRPIRLRARSTPSRKAAR